MQQSLRTTDYIRISLLAALISVSSYIFLPVPFSPVPVTAQSLAIMITGSLLPPLHAFLAVGVFLLLGLLGIPVFAGGGSGLGVLMGPTGGYLIGFLIGAVIIGLIRRERTDLFRLFGANLIGGILVVHFLGAFWLAQLTGLTLVQAFATGSLPFLPGDLTKVILATGLVTKLAPQLHLRSVHHG